MLTLRRDGLLLAKDHFFEQMKFLGVRRERFFVVCCQS